MNIPSPTAISISPASWATRSAKILVASGSFQRYVSMPGLKKSNWFLNRDGNLFYFFYQKNNEKHMIVIEPTDEMIEMIKLYLPRGVYQTN